MRSAISWMLVLVGLAGTVSAVQRPDMTGAWSAVADAPPGLAVAPGPVMGQRFALEIGGDAVTLSRPARGETVIATFRADGSRTRVRVPGRPCEGDGAFFETMAWEGDALALTTVGTMPAGGGPVRELNAKRLLRLIDSDTLLVEGAIVRAGERQAVGTLYRRGEPLDPPVEPLSGRTAATIADVAWITGDWSGTTNGVTTEERWTDSASGAILALSRTLRGELMTSYEFLCIAERDGTLVYTAMPGGAPEPTAFTLTAFDATSATFENPAHDYPQSLRYALRADGALETTIALTDGTRARTVVLQPRR